VNFFSRIEREREYIELNKERRRKEEEDTKKMGFVCVL